MHIIRSKIHLLIGKFPIIPKEVMLKMKSQVNLDKILQKLQRIKILNLKK